MPAPSHASLPAGQSLAEPVSIQGSPDWSLYPFSVSLRKVEGAVLDDGTQWRSMHSGNWGEAGLEVKSSTSFCDSEASSPSRHEVQFYFDDRFLIESLSTFVRKALDSGTAAIVVATKPHCIALADQLRRDGVDLSSAVGQGRYVALDASETLDQFMIDGSPGEKRFRACIGEVISCSTPLSSNQNAKLAIYGEMVSLLWQRGETKAALRLEELWNQLSSDFSFHLRCGYPIASFDRDSYTELFSHICSVHDVVIPAENQPNPPTEGGARTLAQLQQTEQVLKTEALERRIAESRAREAQDQNEQLIKELRKHQSVEEELRRFTRRLLTARDEEQRRIATELHENTAQLLAALSVYFGVLHQEKASLNPRLAKAVASSRSISDNLLNEIRKLSHLLHPPTLDDMGLGAALKDYIDDFNHSRDPRVALEVSKNLGRFDRSLEITVFRIVEEALAGLCPHPASAVTAVRLTRTSSDLMLEIESHQSGNPGPDALVRREARLTGIHERVMEHGGSVHFTSNPSGTRISIKLPLKDPANHRN